MLGFAGLPNDVADPAMFPGRARPYPVVAEMKPVTFDGALKGCTKPDAPNVDALPFNDMGFLFFLLGTR